VAERLIDKQDAQEALFTWLKVVRAINDNWKEHGKTAAAA
jgi:hypothetical protein